MKGKIYFLLLAALVLCYSALLFARGKGSQQQEDIVLDMTLVADPDNIVQGIIADFMAENPGVKIELNVVGHEYENVLKIKMASNELPDIFETHGWAINRYGAYLEDLRRESWASRIDKTIRPIITDDAGKLYVLPIDQEKTGMIYNPAILKEYNIAVPETFEQLLAACETILRESGGKITPIHIGAGDSWPLGFYLDFFATPEFISSEVRNYREEFLDGTFDWSKYTILPERLKNLQDKGYLNKDVITAGYMDTAKAYADNTVAFAVLGPYLITEAQKVNPDIEGAIMPVPSIQNGDTPTFVGGERLAIGVWKDSDNKDAAKKFLEFFARPQNLIQLPQRNLTPSGFSDVKVDLGDLNESYKKYRDIRIFPYFDRVYLPSGMWDIMSRNGQDLLAGNITPVEFKNNMESSFKRLRQQQ